MQMFHCNMMQTMLHASLHYHRISNSKFSHHWLLMYYTKCWFSEHKIIHHQPTILVLVGGAWDFVLHDLNRKDHSNQHATSDMILRQHKIQSLVLLVHMRVVTWVPNSLHTRVSINKCFLQLSWRPQQQPNQIFLQQLQENLWVVTDNT